MLGKEYGKNRVPTNNSTAPKLESLPPTDVAYQENLKRAHLQAAIWRNVLKESPPQVTATDFGCARDAVSSCLIPTFISEGFVLVPGILLTVMSCGCESEQSCKTTHCSCNKLSMSCLARAAAILGHLNLITRMKNFLLNRYSIFLVHYRLPSYWFFP